MMNNTQVIPFGKYKGQPVEVLQADKGYCDWLMAQDWFRERYPQMITLIINNFGQPEDTPEHNSLQAKFLNNDFANMLLLKMDNGRHKDIGLDEIEFEVKGWDVELRFSYNQPYTDCYTHKEYEMLHYGSILVEVKPNVGDDYPSILRQMKSNRGCGFKVLIYQNFTATGATEKQVKQIFKSSGFSMISFSEIKDGE